MHQTLQELLSSVAWAPFEVVHGIVNPLTQLTSCHGRMPDEKVLSSLLIKSLTDSFSNWEQCLKSWPAAMALLPGSNHSRWKSTAASNVALSPSLNKSHSFRARPLKCPANCRTCFSCDQAFHRDALLRKGSQSPILTAGSSPVNGSTGGAQVPHSHMSRWCCSCFRYYWRGSSWPRSLYYKWKAPYQCTRLS